MEEDVLNHSFKLLMRRLINSGFKREFVRTALLPDWWEDTYEEDPNVLLDIEVRVARFLCLPLSVVRDVDKTLAPVMLPGTKLRRVKDLNRDRLAPAIHAAMCVGQAVIRSLRNRESKPVAPPSDGVEWRNIIEHHSDAITLDHILADLWKRGIPVVPLDLLPTPSFQGAAIVIDDHPVIVLGYKHDELGRVAFCVAHEAGHIARGDCTAESPVIDEEQDILDDTDIERRADQYATRLLLGRDTPPRIDEANFKDLARKAVEIENSTGADASTVIFAWAAHTGNYAMASLAVRALYRSIGARRLLRQYFDRHLDLNAANESDRALLRCVYGEPEQDATAV